MSVRAIGRTTTHACLAYIKAALKDADASVRTEAAFAYGHPMYSPCPKSESLKNETLTVRMTLFEIPWKTRQDPHSPVILEALKTSSPEMRPSSFRASHRLNRMAPKAIQISMPIFPDQVLDRVSSDKKSMGPILAIASE